MSTGTVTDAMVDAALNAWFASPPQEDDLGLERSMRAALDAAITMLPQSEEVPQVSDDDCPLTAEELAMIDAAWERHKAAKPTDRNGWQDISIAPKDGAWVFCRWPMMRIGMFPLVVFWDDGWFPAHDYARDYGEVFPTHWMHTTPFEEKQV